MTADADTLDVAGALAVVDEDEPALLDDDEHEVSINMLDATTTAAIFGARAMTTPVVTGR